MKAGKSVFTLFFSPWIFLILYTCGIPILYSQPKYRTFAQTDLALKKDRNAGRATSNVMCYTFKNDNTGVTVDGIEAEFTSHIISIQDSGGFTHFDFSGIPIAFHAIGGSGVYYYRITAEGLEHEGIQFTTMKKMVLLK